MSRMSSEYKIIVNISYLIIFLMPEFLQISCWFGASK